uniref:Uncharacterized protein n=1 Tax=Rhodococcus hoagii TaxID=43767 RepID=A0A1Z1UXC2_RHOHA|nr:hypothetical protein pVAPN1572_0851 [Prescottella equi]
MGLDASSATGIPAITSVLLRFRSRAVRKSSHWPNGFDI